MCNKIVNKVKPELFPFFSFSFLIDITDMMLLRMMLLVIIHNLLNTGVFSKITVQAMCFLIIKL